MTSGRAVRDVELPTPVKHVVATVVTAGCAAVLGGVAYFPLLFCAVVTNSDLGGPLVLPGLAVGSGMIASIVCLTIIMPVTVVTECVTGRTGGVSHGRLLVAMGVMAAYLVGFATIAALMTGSALGAAAIVGS